MWTERVRRHLWNTKRIHLNADYNAGFTFDLSEKNTQHNQDFCIGIYVMGQSKILSSVFC